MLTEGACGILGHRSALGQASLKASAPRAGASPRVVAPLSWLHPMLAPEGPEAARRAKADELLKVILSTSCPEMLHSFTLYR